MFEDDLEKERYEEIRKLPIVPSKCAHNPTLKTLKIWLDVMKLIYNISWSLYYNVDVPTYIELVREFYTTYQFLKPKTFNLYTSNLISFRLSDIHFFFSIAQFHDALGFFERESEHPYCDFCYDFDSIPVYEECDNPLETYDSSKSKDLYLKDPCKKYIHRFLAYSFSDRRDAPSILSKTELFFYGAWSTGEGWI